MIKKFKTFINERNLASVSDKIKIDVDIESTKHSDQRKFRDSNNVISDQDIIDLAEKALPKVTKMLIVDKIDVGDPLHINDTSTSLNLIGVLDGKSMPLTLKIITVMVKRNFKSKRGTKTIIV